MDSLTWLLHGPGEWLVHLLFRERLPVDNEERADFAVTLGIAFWVVLLLSVRIAWSRSWFRSGVLRGGREGARITKEIARRGQPRVQAFVATWSWPKVWGAVWRAEAMHLMLYALVPATIVTARALLFVMFLPFSIMGFGDKPASEPAFSHLHRPACWTFASWCPSPSAEFLARVPDARKCPPDTPCPPAAPVLHSDPYSLVWKSMWALLSAAWILIWRERARRR